MSNRTFIMVFRDEQKLNLAIQMRKMGWTYQSIALVFGVDHSSVYALCKKRHIPVPLHPISLQIPSIISLLDIISAPKEKMYKDYLEDERRRRLPNIYKSLDKVN